MQEFFVHKPFKFDKTEFRTKINSIFCEKKRKFRLEIEMWRCYT